ncbi:hypothetical protein DHEL01_v212380 [Diaporthe helianthi]|uniref:Uncharacterized protein n=1 Tax=Diaporthe helianthi TaxID=158607 RepID=A0A2P5HG49_DIAHE|nr:hypothetical protein DHEL01_v212380 [Diaporthe helianthi]
MHSKLYSLVATTLFLAVLAESSDCYKGGAKFSDLGGTIDISNAFNSICDRIGGKKYQLGEKVFDCENIGDYSVDVSIKVNKDSDSKGAVFELKKVDCSRYLSQITDCERGGYLNIEMVGSHKVKAAVMVDPQQGKC